MSRNLTSNLRQLASAPIPKFANIRGDH